MVELYLWEFMLYLSAAVSFGFIFCGVLANGSKADSLMNNYWVRMAFTARSIMSEDQKKKLDEKMGEK